MGTYDQLLRDLKTFIVEENKKQAELITTNLSKDISEIRNTVSKQQDRLEELERDLKAIKKQRAEADKEVRRNNIIIFNSNFTEGSLLQHKINLIRTYLKIDTT